MKRKLDRTKGQFIRPFIYTIAMDSTVESFPQGRTSLLNGDSWVSILKELIPLSTQIFIEGKEPLNHPDINMILETLDDFGCIYHLKTTGMWNQPADLLKGLQRLRRLDRFRVCLSPGDAERNDYSHFLSAITMASGAGLRVWAIIPLVDGGRQAHDNMVRRITDLGAKGVSYKMNSQRVPPERLFEEAFPTIQALHEGGLPVFIEGDLPIESPPDLSKICVDGIHSYVIDCRGDLFCLCHTRKFIGNLLDPSFCNQWRSSSLYQVIHRNRTPIKDHSSVSPLRSDCIGTSDYLPALEGGMHGGEDHNPLWSESVSRIQLDADLCPVPLFFIREEDFGAILVKGYDFVPISHAGLTIVKAFDYGNTLWDLKKKFGTGALSMAIGLFSKGMIRFARSEQKQRGTAAKFRKNTPHTASKKDSRAPCVSDVSKPIPPDSKELPDNWLVCVTPDLYLSPRDGEILAVEPESASWFVMNERQWKAFRRIGHNGHVRHLGQIPYTDLIDKQDFHDLVWQLFRHNMVSLNGKTFFEPKKMWDIQEFPHYFNIHISDSCNLTCRYCRVNSDKSDLMMNPHVSRTIVRRILEEIPLSPIVISFHGGEPLLNMEAVAAGAQEVIEKADHLNKTVTLLLQTNGTLLTPDIVAKLKALKIKPGISIDGPQCIHDSYRVFPNGKGSYQCSQKGLRIAAEEGLGFGYLAVVHEPERYVDVLDHMVREFGATAVRINYASSEGRAKEELDFSADRGERFAREWLKMVDYAEAYEREKGVWLDISDLNLFIFHLLSRQRPQMCYRSPCGIGNATLGFGYDGKIYLCDEFVGNSLFCIGDIMSDTHLKDLLLTSPVKNTAMASRTVENLSKCSTCHWRRFHGGGCASKVFAAYGTLKKEDPMCRFFDIIIEELMWRLWKNNRLANLAGHYKGLLKNQVEWRDTLCKGM